MESWLNTERNALIIKNKMLLKITTDRKSSVASSARVCQDPGVTEGLHWTLCDETGIPVSKRIL